jgi:hypothetical protein
MCLVQGGQVYINLNGGNNPIFQDISRIEIGGPPLPSLV